MPGTWYEFQVIQRPGFNVVGDIYLACLDPISNLQFDSDDTIRLARIHATLASDLASIIGIGSRDPLAQVSIGFGSFWPVS